MISIGQDVLVHTSGVTSIYNIIAPLLIGVLLLAIVVFGIMLFFKNKRAFAKKWFFISLDTLLMLISTIGLINFFISTYTGPASGVYFLAVALVVLFDAIVIFVSMLFFKRRRTFAMRGLIVLVPLFIAALIGMNYLAKKPAELQHIQAPQVELIESEQASQ